MNLLTRQHCKNGLIFILTTVVLHLHGVAQLEPMYSQYMFNMMNVNPAYAGSRGVPNLTALFRNQWSGMPGAPRTGNVSFDMPFATNNSAIGFQMYTDRIGVQKTQGLKFNYAYRAQAGESGVISMGLNLGLRNRRANYTDVNTFVPGDPVFNSNISSINVDAGAGIFYNTDNFYIGASAPFLLKSNVSSNDPLEAGAKWLEAVKARDLNVFLTAGFVVYFSEQLVLKPSAMLKRSGSAFQADINSNLWINDMISLGVSYRTKESVIGMLEWQMTPKLRFGYSYDRSINNLRLYNSGSHEFMLRIEFGTKSEESSIPNYF
jgi:type IX secretion system PorP/SprF family membrane protein